MIALIASCDVLSAVAGYLFAVVVVPVCGAAVAFCAACAFPAILIIIAAAASIAVVLILSLSISALPLVEWQSFVIY